MARDDPDPALRVYVAYGRDRALFAPLQGDALSESQARRLIHRQKQRFRGLPGLKFFLSWEPLIFKRPEIDWLEMRDRLDAALASATDAP